MSGFNGKDLEPFFIKDEEEFTVGIREGKQIIAYCIGSGNNIRNAKASAIKNIRKMLRMVREMGEEIVLIGNCRLKKEVIE